MPIRIATFDGTDLPLGFRYIPYVPKKRVSVIDTANAVVVQAAAPFKIVNGGQALTWSLKSAYPTEFQTFVDWYDEAALTLYEFEGYWGEKFEVRFHEFRVDEVKGGFFDLSGAFQVVEVLDFYSATCTT